MAMDTTPAARYFSTAAKIADMIKRLGIYATELKYRVILRHEFFLNHGIMEYWNDGIVGFQRISAILNFIVGLNFTIYPILQFSKTHYSAKASLRAQYSSIPPFQLERSP
jgi:hypothetical protein